MKIAGVDPSSSITGVALVENDQLVLTDAWHRPKTGSPSERLTTYFLWLQNWLSYSKPDIAVIEYLSVTRNAEATRVISHYQAASAIACKLRGLLVVEARVTSARKASLGKGNMSKEEAYKKVKSLYPDENWGTIKNGGADRADALILALGGISLAES